MKRRGLEVETLRPEPEAQAAQRRKYVSGLQLAAAGLALALVGWLFLHQLGVQPLQYWDESRLALNALGIGLHHDALVMYYGKFPDTLNTKPPLVPNLQALAYAVFGVSVWALRLPAAVAALLTAAVLLLFAWRAQGRLGAGILAAVALATMPGFNGVHVAHTGDYDAPLALLTVGYCLAGYRYLQQPRRRWLLLFGSALAGALLVKCSAALLPLPGLLLYAWWHAPARLRDRRARQALAAAFGPLLLFYILREIAYPGYLHFTLFYDWAGAAALPLTGPTPWWFYFPILLRGLGWWSGALVLGGGLALALSRGLPPLARFGLWQAAALLLVGIITQTRMPWYITHAYPLLALAIGSAAGAWATQGPARWLVPALVGLVGLGAGIGIFRQHQQVARMPLAPFEQYPRALRQLDHVPLPSAAVLVLTERYNPLVDYYLLTAPPPRRLQLTRTRLPDQQPELKIQELLPGQQVFGCLPQVRRLVEQQFVATPLATLDACWCLRLDCRRARP